MTSIKKYWAIVKAFWQRALTYRFTIVAYRIGEIAEVVFLIIMWTAIYHDTPIIRGYTLQEMITYVLVGNVFNVMVRNWLSPVVGRDIKDGTLSVFLVKPIRYLTFILWKEVGRVSVAFLMSVVTQVIIVLFFLDQFLINRDLRVLSLIASMLVLAFLTELLLSFLIGLIAFWTDEVDGLYQSVDRLKKFFAGGYFPLSLLPTTIASLATFLPFAYAFYVPSQLYLGKMTLTEGIIGLGVQTLWIIALLGLIEVVWRRGLRRYEGIGI